MSLWDNNTSLNCSKKRPKRRLFSLLGTEERQIKEYRDRKQCSSDWLFWTTEVEVRRGEVVLFWKSGTQKIDGGKSELFFATPPQSAPILFPTAFKKYKVQGYITLPGERLPSHFLLKSLKRQKGLKGKHLRLRPHTDNKK